MRSEEPFPWSETLGFLLGVLGWPPDAAWRATIPEIRAAAAGRFGPAHTAAPELAMLATLMAAFPDDDSTGAP